MVNISYQELSETKAQQLPPPDLETLKIMRNEMCATSSSRDFKIQPSQRFLRRVLSPESPVRNILLVHGTGSGKTCSAIQIAEEYIIRPEFQDKKVLVLANPSIQENFKQQIFDISRVSVDADGLLLSKQCTGRRYLEMLQRSQLEPLRYTDKTAQVKIMRLASRIIEEFYDFQGYAEFANILDRKKISMTGNEVNKWIHETFDNRLIVVDEAHNLRETTETTTTKLIGIAMEQILKTATGVTLVLLTATPMYDQYDELLYYFNMFMWNERIQASNEYVKPSDIFTDTGDFKEGKESVFRGWCQDYVSFIKGDNPFTFPFRLPPPESIIAVPDRETDIFDEEIKTPRKYLTLVRSMVSPLQEAAIKPLKIKATTDPNIICVYPNNLTFRDTFEKTPDGFSYKKGVEKFLAPSKVSMYSSKFGLITNILDNTEGVVFVFSNLVENGAQLFAMCLEEHGYEPAIGKNLLSGTSSEVPKGSKGKYVLFTAEISVSDINKSLTRLRRPENADGSDIRVIIASPKVSEGVDFRFVRQIHVLDPWFNMSRIEQVIGRGMRTCSHAALPFEDQNCTVYLHVCRYPDSTKETIDEYIYRVFVEGKAIKIAKVKRIVMESAMDCELQQNLPLEWRNLKVPQIRGQDKQELQLSISQMSAPSFEEGMGDLTCNVKQSVVDPDHTRPLSAIMDVRDEIFDKLLVLFAKKPIWDKADLFSHSSMKQYSNEVLTYILQNAIDTGFQLKDKMGRVGHLQMKKDVYTLTFDENNTMMEMLLKPDTGSTVNLRVHEAEPEVAPPKEMIKHEWDAYLEDRFSEDVLNWWVADNIMTTEQKLEMTDWEDPPFYAKDLIANGAVKLIILGTNKVYKDGELITPAGVEADVYRNWINQQKDSFIERKEEIFASLKDKDQGIVFNIDEKSADEIRRALRSKVIGGRACTSYTAPVLNAFAEWLNGEPFPKEVKTKKDRCLFLDLLFKEAILNEKEGIFWVPPELLEIFNEDEHRGDLLKRLKE